MEEKNTKLGKLALSPKSIFILGILGIVLIGVSSVLGLGNTGDVPTDDYTAQTKMYVEETETKIEEILSKTRGVGKAHVLITVQNGAEYLYAKDEKERDTGGNTEIESKYILIDGQAGRRQALVLTQIEPKIKGVVVVCDGGDDPVVRQRVSDIVTTSLGISSLQVCILQVAA